MLFTKLLAQDEGVLLMLSHEAADQGMADPILLRYILLPNEVLGTSIDDLSLFANGELMH